jgi:hypothetical protein
LKYTLLLRLNCRNQPTARKLASVLAPDNRSLPSDQRLSMSTISRSVVFRIETERERAALTTASGILRDVALFQGIWLISSQKGG